MKYFIFATAIVLALEAYVFSDAEAKLNASIIGAPESGQVVELEVARTVLSNDQFEALQRSTSVGYSVKTVPVVQNDVEHFVVILGERVGYSTLSERALRSLADQFVLTGVDGIQMRDLESLEPTDRSLTVRLFSFILRVIGREGKFRFAKKTAASDILSARPRIVYNSGSGLFELGVGKARIACWLDAGDLTNFKSADPQVSPRDLRMVSNVRKVFSDLSAAKQMLMVVDRGSIERIAELLQQGNPPNYKLEVNGRKVD